MAKFFSFHVFTRRKIIWSLPRNKEDILDVSIWVQRSVFWTHLAQSLVRMEVVTQLVHLRANRSATCHVRKSNLHQRLTIVWPCLFGLLSRICLLRVKFKVSVSRCFSICSWRDWKCEISHTHMRFSIIYFIKSARVDAVKECYKTYVR